MDNSTTLIKNGTVITEGGSLKANILIKNGIIVSLLEPRLEFSANKTINASGLTIMPGCIDVHVHYWEPWDNDIEGFYRGTCSAAAGGITTILEMPNSRPMITNIENFQKKLEVAKRESIVDFGLYAAIVPDNLGDIKDLHNQGVIAFKMFMTTSRTTFPHLNDAELFTAIEKVNNVGSIPVIHAESHLLVKMIEEKLKKEGNNDISVLKKWRPPITEIDAIQKILLYAKELNARVHIAHVSAAEVIKLIAQAKYQGQKVTMETCPQYLFLDDGMIEKLGPFMKCIPPVRSIENQKVIWKHIEDGTIDVVASDHTSYSLEDKNIGYKNIWKASNGINGIQVMFPLLCSEVIKRKIDIKRFVQLSATIPAKIFGLYPRKGTVQVGSEADLVFYDLNQKWNVSASALFSKYKWTPFDGMHCRGIIKKTMVRGEIVYSDHEIKAKKGYGRFISPK